MPFYKRQDQDLLSATNFVYAPTYTLDAEEKDTYTYPVDGWYWFGTLDLAMSGMVTKPLTVTRRQFKLALFQLDLLDIVEGAIAASSDRSLQITYVEALDFDITNPMVAALAATLGKTQAELEALFALATTL